MVGAAVYICILFLIALTPQSQTGCLLSDFISPSWLLFFSGLFDFSKNGAACELVNFQKNDWIAVLLKAGPQGTNHCSPQGLHLIPQEPQSQ